MGWNQMSYLAADVKPLAERMGTAALNTVIGISIVFLVLIIISFLISLFKYVNKLETKLKQKNTVNLIKEEPVSEPIPEQDDLEEEEELVAVLTAAIYAYEASQGVNLEEGDFLVQSIRKIKRKTIA